MLVLLITPLHVSIFVRIFRELDYFISNLLIFKPFKGYFPSLQSKDSLTESAAHIVGVGTSLVHDRKNGYESLLADLKLAVDTNDEIIGHILKDVDNVFENLSHENRGRDANYYERE